MTGKDSYILANELLEVNEEMTKIFTCSVCLDLFQTPKVMPNCGHSLCSDCAKQIIPENGNSKLICPECRTETQIDKAGVEKLKTNFPAQRAAELLAKHETSKFPVGEFCPHAGSKSSKKCPHCQLKFCSLCLVSHLERVKVETLLTANLFKNRLKSASSDSASKLKKIEAVIEEKVQAAQQKIRAESDRILSAVQQAIVDYTCHLISETQRFGDEQLARAIGVIGMVVTSGGEQSFDANVQRLSGMSPLFNSTAGFAKIFADMNQRVDNVKALEQLETTISSANIIFTDNDNSIVNLIESAKAMFGVTFDKQELAKADDKTAKDTVLEMLHGAIKTRDTGRVRDIFSSLTPALQAFVGQSPAIEEMFLLACENEVLETAKFLHEDYGADIYACRDDGTKSSAMHFAAKNGHLEVVKYLLSLDPGLLDLKDGEGRTPINVAASSTLAFEVMQFLAIQSGADVEQDDTCVVGSGRTLLLQAVADGRLEFAKFLIEKAGADVNALDHNGRSATALAVLSGNADLVKYLMRGSSVSQFKDAKGNSILHSACIDGDLELVEGFLKMDPSLIECRGQYGRTPLEAAAVNGHLEIIRFLIEKGANMFDMATESGYMAIHIACYYGHRDVVAFFIGKDRKFLSATNRFGKTILNLARSNNHGDIIAMIEREL